MATAKCVYCGKEQDDHKGTYLLKNDGSVNYYSSGKCMKGQVKLGRDKRKVRWTESFHETRAKRAEKRKVQEEKRKAAKAKDAAKKAAKK